VICAVCHATLPDDSRYCLSCGADLSDPSAERRPMDTVADIQGMLTAVVAGHYKIHRLLGRGGMGTVFLADDLTLDRQVAIKVLPPKLTSEEKFVGRFLHEARTAAKLDHPNIIPIFAVESHGDLHFFVMRYVNGRTLDQLLAGGAFPVDECRRILHDAAAGLGHAHSRGIVHRDVKPSNIMVDDTGRVVLGDFGISKALESATQFTGTGQYVGTPHYMSPEQAKGLKLDGRSDQYSLGVVGYQMLTGETLFQAESPHSAMYKHVHEPPRSPRGVRPDTPEFLERAILRALAKEPQARYPTMEEFGAAVYPESGKAAYSTPSETTTSGVRLRGRRRWLVPSAVGAVVVVAAAAALLLRGGGTAASPAAAPAAAPVTSPGVAAPSARPGGTGGGTATPGGATTKAPAPSQGAPPQRTPAPPSPRDTTARATPRPAPAAAAPVAATGFLTIDSDPYGTVSIDGVDIGDTPIIKHALRPGTYTVRISRDGYRPWSETITITSGNTERRRGILQPQQP